MTHTIKLHPATHLFIIMSKHKSCDRYLIVARWRLLADTSEKERFSPFFFLLKKMQRN